jgi:hypothetical protein
MRILTLLFTKREDEGGFFFDAGLGVSGGL